MTSMLQDFAPDRAETAVPCFAFGGARGFITGRGVACPVARGPAATLEERVATVWRSAGTDAAIGGALPFDRDADDYLWLTEHLGYETSSAATGMAIAPTVGVRAEPSAQEYADAVAEALRIMDAEKGAEGLRKIVLARTLAVQAERPISPAALLSRLTEDPAATAYRVALPDSAGRQGRSLVGATPELLVEKAGRRVSSFPLAGSARRSRDPRADAAAASSLAASEKDRREHAMVVEYILDTLAPWCRELGAPEGTGLTSTRSMWHLGTRIEGQLKDGDIPSVVLAGSLHPTPAVCGLPRDRAAGLIRRLEPVARGFYAGAVGWSAANGDGAWYVAIRCAELCGSEARLYAARVSSPVRTRRPRRPRPLPSSRRC
ncbi:isochorismate synthase [Paracoccus methylarcula]|uniref:isochorismate synthase n=1 Tax=Paracoccus methylarcula TaxID=72022 RepID=UPI001FEAFD5E|nr:chorismate-binding protein [Paracoccus methylarcula]